MQHQITSINNTRWLPKVLTIGSGGIKGFTCLGFLMRLEEFLDDVEYYSGCSVGAMICLLLMSGYSCLDIFLEASEMIENLLNISSLNLKQITKRKGILGSSILKTQMEKMMMDKFSIVPTFNQLYTLCGNKKICIVTSELSGECIYMNKNTFPDLSVVEAILMSSNIPGAFEEIIIDNKFYIDGAFTNPYPINVFDNGIRNVLGIHMSGQIKVITNNITNNNENETNLSKASSSKTSSCNLVLVPKTLDVDDSNDDIKATNKTIAEYCKEILYCSINYLRKTKIKESSNKCKHIHLHPPNPSWAFGKTDIVMWQQRLKLVEYGWEQGGIFLDKLSSSGLAN